MRLVLMPPGLLALHPGFLRPAGAVLWLRGRLSGHGSRVRVGRAPGAACSGPRAGASWVRAARTLAGAPLQVRSPRSHEPVDGSRGAGSSVRSPGSEGVGVPDAQRSLPPLPGGSELGPGVLPPQACCVGAGVPTRPGPRTSEAWVLSTGRGGGLWGGHVPAGRRPAGGHGGLGTQLSGAWRHRGCGSGPPPSGWRTPVPPPRELMWCSALQAGVQSGDVGSGQEAVWGDGAHIALS